MRLLVLTNDKLKAVEALKKDYDETGVDFTYDVENYDVPINFVTYYGTVKGLDYSTVRKLTREAKKKHGGKYDAIVIFIKYEDWDEPYVMGWSMGRFYSDYQFSQVRGDDYRVLAQELLHTWDNFAKLEMGIDLASLLGVNDFDEDIVHAYQFEYKEFYTKLALVINRTFEIRRIRYEKEKVEYGFIQALQAFRRILRMKLINIRKSIKGVVNVL